MRFCKKIRVAFALLFVFAYALAASSSIVIKNADLKLLDNAYILSADSELTFDESIEEAINKGVPLNFLVEFQLVSPRKYWFDNEIVTNTTSFTLSYHALSRQYLVSHNGHQNSYETLSEAKLELEQIDDWKVFEKSMVDKKQGYKASLSMRLDQSKLPKALQVEAIGSESWNLKSQMFDWLPKELSK
ncbi:MAG: DUF4390 domain-containing protein [Methylophilaceae bacterium]